MALALAVTSVIAPPRPAQAIVGLATGNAVLAIAGGAVLAIGTAITVATLSHPTEPNGNSITDVVEAMDADFSSIAIGVLVGIGGLVLLDQGGSMVPQYATLTDTQIAKMGIASQDAREMNEQLPEINALVQNIAFAAQDAATTSEATEISKNIWAANQDQFTPGALRALVQVSNYTVNSVKR